MEQVVTMQFKMTHRHLQTSEPEYFDESTAPDWLTSVNTVKGSAKDKRAFYERVLALEVGQTIKTDFRIIERIGDLY